MPTETKIDANNETASSADSGQNQQDSSPSQDSSTAQTKEPTMADIARQAYDAATQRESVREDNEQGNEAGEPGQEAQETQGQQGTVAEGQEGQEGQGQQQEQAQGSEGQQSEQGEQGEQTQQTPEQKKGEQPPFHEHPRWKEVVQQNQDYTRRLTELEPLANRQRYHENFMNEMGISPEEFVNGMNILAAVKTDPAKARELLAPIWNQLSEFDGSVIPQDLRQRVAEGEMSEQAAKELAQLRVEKKLQEHNARVSTTTQAQRTAKAKANALASWDHAKRKLDPDFHPKKAQDAPDGLWEITAAKLTYLMTVDYPDTPEKAISHMEKAYNEAKRLVVALRGPLPKTRLAPNSRRSIGSVPKGAPKTIRDVVRQVASQHGIDWQPQETEE